MNETNIERVVMPRVLHLTLKKRWFDLIASGEKTDEYREIKPYWNTRLAKEFDVIKFRNGYAKNARTMVVELLNKAVGAGRPEHGAPTDKAVHILRLGKVLEA